MINKRKKTKKNENDYLIIKKESLRDSQSKIIEKDELADKIMDINYFDNFEKDFNEIKQRSRSIQE